MRMKIKITFLLPLAFSLFSCSSSDKITFKTGNNTFETYYNDKYFLLDNRDVHEEIALASHAMASATFNGDKDYNKRPNNLIDLWKKERFSNYYFNEFYYQKPGTDTVAFGIAGKHINVDNSDFTVIAIAVRGGNYDAEWASNFTLGMAGNSRGFDDASDMVVTGFYDYLNKFSISGHIKIWISGFSRAAITSNMTAGKLLNHMNANTLLNNSISFNRDDVYAYCFEPPMGVESSLVNARGELYHGIHNFLNYNDFVPLVAPFEWGFARYGTDHYYPDRINDINFDMTEREKIITLYHFTKGAQNFPEYTVDNWKFFDVGEIAAAENNLARWAINPSQGRFSHTLIHEVATRGFVSRERYAQYIENGMREIFAAVYGLNPLIGEISFSNIVELIFEYDFIKSLVMELEGGESADFALDAEMLFLQVFGANEENFENVRALFSKAFYLFYFLPQAFEVRKDILSQLVYRDNAMGIAIGHMPELSYTFLRACDSRVMGKKHCHLNDGGYYIIHIDNPVNFTLKETQWNKVVFEFKDNQMISKCLSAERFADGSVNVYVPKNGKYHYESNCDSLNFRVADPLTGESGVALPLPKTGEF